jgi:hypothetical protein
MPARLFPDCSFTREAAGLAVLCGLCLLLTGCGGAAPEVQGLVPVSGVVTYKGEPLTSGVITFVPVGPTGQPASGNIGADGRYEAMTGTSAIGVHPGDYTVRVESWSSPPSMGEGGAMDPGTSAIPQKYNDAGTSGLSATITAGDSREVNFRLEG